MTELQFLLHCVARLDVLDVLKELQFSADGAEHGAQASHVLRVAPAGVVPPAVAMGDEREWYAQRTGRRLRKVSRYMDPSTPPESAILAASSSTSKPFSFITNSA